MKFRIESTLGWMMLGGLGGELTGAYRRGLFPAQLPPMHRTRGRASGKSLDLHAAQRRLVEQRPTPAPVIAIDEMANVDAALELFGDELANMAREWGVGAEGIAAAINRVLRDQTTAAADAEAGAETHTYLGNDGLWWISYANDSACAGVAIVHLVGEQSAELAVATARTLGLEPQGEWQAAAIRVPEEGRAEHAPFAGRFLTTAEAEAAFQAQSIRAFEADNPGAELDLSGLQLIDTRREYEPA